MLNYYLFITPKAAHNTTSQLLRQKNTRNPKNYNRECSNEFLRIFLKIGKFCEFLRILMRQATKS